MIQVDESGSVTCRILLIGESGRMFSGDEGREDVGRETGADCPCFAFAHEDQIADESLPGFGG